MTFSLPAGHQASDVDSHNTRSDHPKMISNSPSSKTTKPHSMARRALSLQCRIITVIAMLAVLSAFISLPYQSGITSAKFRYRRDSAAHVSNGDAVLDDLASDQFSNVSNALVKRGMIPASDLATVLVYVTRGCLLSTLTFETQGQVMDRYGPSIVSPSILADAVAQSSGWTRVVVSANFDINTVAQYLVGLDNVEGIKGSPTDSHVLISLTQDWTHSRLTQDQPYTRTINGVSHTYQPTHAVHEQVSSTARVAGVIIILNSWDPRFMSGHLNEGHVSADDELPEVGFWSHIGFAELNNLQTDLAAVKPKQLTIPDPKGTPVALPRWILVPLIWGPNPSLSIISYCLGTYDLLGLPTWEKRVTFPIGSFCFEAILGTPQGESLAMFLIQHKYRFGKATLVSVTVFGTGFVSPINGYELPSLLWYVLPTSKKRVRRPYLTLQEMRAQNAAWSAVEGNDPKNMPHMLQPLY